MYRNIIIPRRKQSTLNRVTTIYLDTSPPNSYSHFSFRLQFYLIAVQLTCLLSSILWGTTSWPKMLVGRHWCVFGWVRNARFNRKVTSVSIKFRVNLSLSIIFCFLSFVFIISYTYIHNIGLIKPKQIPYSHNTIIFIVRWGWKQETERKEQEAALSFQSNLFQTSFQQKEVIIVYISGLKFKVLFHIYS